MDRKKPIWWLRKDVIGKISQPLKEAVWDLGGSNFFTEFD